MKESSSASDPNPAFAPAPAPASSFYSIISWLLSTYSLPSIIIGNVDTCA
jgi:hypothetical protein